MPCYDPQVAEENQKILRVACELSKFVPKNLFPFLSDETREWVTEHLRRDKLHAHN